MQQPTLAVNEDFTLSQSKLVGLWAILMIGKLSHAKLLWGPLGPKFFW